MCVGGRQIVDRGTCLDIPLDDAQRLALDTIPQRDWAARNADQLSPLAFPAERS